MNKYIIDTLISARKAKGLKQRDVANLLGDKSPATISGYETGFSEPSIDILARLCEIYEIDLGMLMKEAYELQDHTEKKHSVSSILKQLRSNTGYTAAEVSHRLNSFGFEISAKTLYGYESGLSMPNADIFLALCEIYECNNPLDIFGRKQIRPSELELLRKYRCLGAYEQNLVNTILDMEYNKK